MIASPNLGKSETEALRTLISTFNTLYQARLNTVIAGGAVEPLYQPADAEHEFNTIYFTRDYFASALHEIAHWCIAGDQRRKRVDYGYWYAPDGRDASQQALFERVEVKPQAIEWILSRSCGHKFRLSADNLEGDAQPSATFRKQVCAQAKSYCTGGLPTHALELVGAFSQVFGLPSPLIPEHYEEAALT